MGFSRVAGRGEAEDPILAEPFTVDDLIDGVVADLPEVPAASREPAAALALGLLVGVLDQSLVDRILASLALTGTERSSSLRAHISSLEIGLDLFEFEPFSSYALTTKATVEAPGGSPEREEFRRAVGEILEPLLPHIQLRAHRQTLGSLLGPDEGSPLALSEHAMFEALTAALEAGAEPLDFSQSRDLTGVGEIEIGDAAFAGTDATGRRRWMIVGGTLDGRQLAVPSGQPGTRPRSVVAVVHDDAASPPIVSVPLLTERASVRAALLRLSGATSTRGSNSRMHLLEAWDV